MKCQFLTQAIIAVTLAAAGADAEVLEKGVYEKIVAPNVLQRIASYRESHGSGLSSAQISILSEAERVVNDFDVENVAALKHACSAVFSEEECLAIMTGPRPPVQQASPGLGRRTNLCSCTDEDPGSDCPSGFRCQYGAGNCGMFTGCGFLDIYVCNGLCQV
ncbi:hypothetical protein NQ176_g5755 [Zarea fungicola]|uniref:Uncharacterized protein n=1 Tax=Zarea fungicola TaxID=93591 RepID=A0ACC1N889_9HYPO|nr:hypothetical protein NQ176_g5755 [Lecanicillium fungicola]